MAKVSPAPEMEPGRRVGVLVDTAKGFERGYVFIRDLDDEDYFAHKNVFPASLFAGIRDGDAVSFRWAVTTKGRRAYDVQPATVTEQARVAELEENRGNR